MSTAGQRPPSSERLSTALARVGVDSELRAAVVDMCKRVETKLAEPGVSIRDEVTGPIVDALFARLPTVRKSLSNELVFEFQYRTKIDRDFVMSTPATPDHVWEPQTTRLLVHFARTADHVVIGGAYFGDQALPVAQVLAERGGICHAFEPNPDQRRMLERNVELNGLRNVRVSGSALWHVTGASGHLKGEGALAYFEQAAVGERAEACETITIDEYLSRLEIPELDLLMLDLEGGELAALQGCRARLSRPAGSAPTVVYEIHRNYVDWSNGLENTEIVGMLRSLGYLSYAVRDFNSNHDMRGRPIELVPLDDIYLEGPPHGFNMLAIKDPTVIEGPTFKICPGVSPKLLPHKDPRIHHPTDGL